MMPATGFLWKAFLSLDQTLDASDVPLYTSTTPLNCPGGTTVMDVGMATIPLPAPGNYYVLVQADSSNVVMEADETNNVGSTANYFVQGLDLVASSISGPAMSGPGNMMTVELKYYNQGTDPAGTVNYEVRLSKDQTFSTSDFVLYSGSKVISGGQMVDDMVTFTVPDNTPGGDAYYILHIIPVPMETSTANNDVASSATVTIRNADLVPSATDLVDPATGISTRKALFGQPARLTTVAQNTGGADARNFKVAVVLSIDANLSLISDTIVAEVPVTGIAAGTSQVLSIPFTFPLNDARGKAFTTGNYYVFVLLDSQDQVTELNEQNNSEQVGPVLISAPAPDLTVVRIDAPASAGQGEIAPVYRVLKNIGNVDSPEVKYRYYLSANQTITPDDTPLTIVSGSTPMDSGSVQLAIGQVDAATEMVQLPGNVTPGTWYIGALIDPDNTLVELDKTNNGLASAPVLVAASSLRVATPSLPDGILQRTYSFRLAVTGDVPGMPSTWTIDETQGPLPPGLSLSMDGLLSGTPTQTGAWGFTVVVANAGRQAIARLAMRVLPTTTQVEITTGGLPSIVNSATLMYEVDLGASGGALPYTWSILNGTLPPSITLDPAKGIISGFPRAGTAEGMSSITIGVRDSLGTTAQKTFSLRVVAAGSIIFQQLSIPDALVGIQYTTDIPVANADNTALAKPLTFQLVGGALPPGMSVHTEQEQTEILSGTPLVAGMYPFTLSVTDNKGREDVGEFILRVYPERLIVGVNGIPEAVRPGDTLDFNFLVPGNLNATFTIYAGALPPGTTMDTMGHVTGKVDEVNSEGTYNFVVQAEDPKGSTGLGAFTVQVNHAAPRPGGCSAAPAGFGLWLLVAFLPLLGLRRRARGLGLVAVALVLAPLTARAQDYSVAGPSPITYSALPAAVSVSSGAAVDLPFTFKFYGEPITSVTMGRYGYLALEGSDPSESFNQGIPGMDSLEPSTVIAPWWDDLDTTGGGLLRYQTFGVAPNRYIAFEWANVYPTGGASSQRMSFQVILYEGTNQIRFAYGGSAPSTGSASVGIQKTLGTGLAALGCTSPTSGDCSSANYPGSPSPSAIDFFLPADLTIVSLSMDQIGYAGVPFHAAALVGNIGGRVAPGTIVRFYLSTDTMIDASDPVIGDTPAQSVPANGQLLMNLSGLIPMNTTPANYFVLTQVNPNGDVVESDYTNNIGAPTGIQVGMPTPDLVVSNVTAPTMATPGQTIMAGITIANLGNADAPPFKYTWFLSDNSVVSISDLQLGNPIAVGSDLAAGMPHTQTDALMLPASLTAGQYWIGACANFDPGAMPQFGIAEISQVNNCNQSATPIVVSSGALMVLTTTLPMATQYAPIGLRLQASGGTGSYQWQLGTGSALPPGMHLATTGDFTGSPAIAGNYSFTVQVTSGGAMKTQMLTLMVAPGNIPLTIVDQEPPAAEFGNAYEAALIAVGGKPPYLWSLKPDAVLPLGLNLSNDGLIEGRALETGDFSFGVICTDSTMTTSTKDLRIRVVNPSTMHIATSKLKTAYLKQDYTQELDAVGGKPPYTWTVTRFEPLPQNPTDVPGSAVDGGVIAGLPDSLGITLEDSNTDYLKGVPLVAGLYVLELHVADANGAQDGTTLLLTVSYTDPIAITTTALPDAFVDHDYQAKLSHNRGKESTGVQFSIPCIEEAVTANSFMCAPMDATQNLPPGLELKPDGTIHGSPVDPDNNAANKTYTFLVKVQDDAGRTDVRSLSIRMRPPIGAQQGCGCSSEPVGAIVLLALAAIRRRKGAPKTQRASAPNGVLQ
jgi:uncharacterized repeat protein (TIGR01451 family)